ncbi:MAG: hypothetical protein FWC36_05040 [Spirochaetes bacterium]|nr:hypothetical protein [Spirochaetota bacterium]
MSEKDSICCPQFNPVPWDSKVLEWDNKKFVKESVRTFFNIPMNFGSVMKKIMKKAEETKAFSSDFLCLSEHTSKWNMDLYLAVNEEIAGLENTTLTGNFFSKVYEGSFGNTKNWFADFKTQAEKIGLKIGKTYTWYATCPKCAKKYGKNYVVIVGRIDK